MVFEELKFLEHCWEFKESLVYVFWENILIFL